MSNPDAAAAIRTLISRYSQAAVTKDTAAWGSTWADDGAWDLMGQRTEGRDEVVAHFASVMSGLQFVFQLAGEASIELDASGRRGTGRVPTIEFVKVGDGPGTLMLGTYEDVYVERDGAWLFAERRMKISYVGPSDLSGAPLPS
jgi:hypothetical protein